MIKSLFVVFVITLSFASEFVFSASLLPSGEHCVAYRAKKTLFLVNNVYVVGRSCEVAVQVIPELDSRYRIEMSLPITSLKSGEVKRDQDVADLLKSKDEPELAFVSESLPQKEWQELAKKGKFVLKGALKIGGNSYPIQSEVILSEGSQGVEFDGVAKTTFKDLNLKPPSLWLGLFAKVRNDLELHFHFLGQKTMGLEPLLAK